MNRPVFAALAASTALISQAVIAEEVTDLDPIVVSGNLTPQPKSKTAASVEVIEGDDLKSATKPLSYSLSALPGVSATQSGPLGTTSSVSIRGLPARYIAVRVDGFDVSDPTSTQVQFNFAGLTSAGVGRVEVLKGSQSALYGSEAVGGLIDIRSARPTKLGFSAIVGAEAGSYGTYSGNVMLGYKDDKGEVALNISRTETDGFSARSSDTEADGSKKTQVNLTFRYSLSDTLTVGGAILYSDLAYEYDNTATDPSGTGTDEKLGARVFAEFVTGAVTHELSFSHIALDRSFTSSTFSANYRGERTQLSYLGNVEIAAGTLTFGLDRTEEAYFGIGSVKTNSAFAEALFQPGQFDLSLALRYDDHSQFGGHFSGRLGAVWHVGENTDLRALVSTGFRAPSLNELYGPFGGNPNLQTEQSRTAELGITHRFGSVGSVSATLYYTEIDNLIEYFDPDGWLGPIPGGYTQRPGTTTSKGIEIAGRYALSDQYELYGNYTYTDVRNGGARLVQVPLHSAVLGLNAEISPRVSAYAEIQHKAGALASAFAPAANRVGDYTLLNVGMSVKVNDRFETYLRVENLTDEKYETVGGYNQAGRSVFFGLRGEF